MDASKKHQVSLRGASAKEITRDALLEKVSHERELRNFARRATAAALFIQRVWKRYLVTKKLALQLQEEWEVLLGDSPDLITKTYISSTILRPFLFFITRLSVWVHKLSARNMECIRRCFYLLLESLKSTDPNRNFCSLAIGITEERKIWTYQVKRLISLCSFVIGESKLSERDDTDPITSIVARLLVTLTDLNGWRCITDGDRPEAEKVLRELIWFMGSDKGGLYKSVGRYVSKLNASALLKGKVPVQPDDKFLTTASIITIALRPFLVVDVDARDPLPIEMKYAAEQYCIYVLSVPWLVQRIPSVLLPALRHKTILQRCFRILLISNGNVFTEYSLMDRSGDHSPQRMPRVGWALSNIISLCTGCQNDTCRFSDGVDSVTYIRVLNNLTHHFLSRIESLGWTEKTLCYNGDDGSYPELVETLSGNADMEIGSIKYLDLFSPVCQQWHLMKLLNAAERDTVENKSEASKSNCKGADRLKLLDIAYLYSYMMRIYSILNMTMGSAPVLNLLSFTPGFLVKLWGELEGALFLNDRISTNLSRGASEKKQKQKNASKEPTSKWVSTLNKITGKSQADKSDMVQAHTSDHLDIHDSDDLWDVECLRGGPTFISKDTSCLLQLFCASYAHLLLILDDIEFYERQVPFSLEQQQKIASVLNTLVYNGLFQNSGSNNRALMDSAIRCLQMLYERDCRHQFCPLDLWLAPGRKSRPPIATAARVHEAYLAKQDDSLNNSMLGSFITTTPYVYPFDERVQMFREFIKMDKSNRKMAGELMGPGDRAIDIVIRRGHLVEDGYRQLNSLGSKLKSTIHVSFVSECGLPEAGLDYGGLSKEFLTDLVKASFDPEYGLFCQTLTSERHLIPSSTARFQENGIQMIEFFGRIVGKVLYEEFLLDFSFSHVFVQKLLGRYSFLDELSALDPELYKNLMYVKHYDGDVMELSLDFTVTEELFGKRHIIELKPGGKNTTVTNENKLQYIHAMADYKLNRQLLPLSNAFYRGLTDLISPSWLKLFNASEFNQLLSGGNIDINIDDLRRNTRYTGGYSEGSRAVKLFWEVMTGFEPKERCMVLKFVTSCSRAPLLGFKYLQPTFTIHKVPCDVPIWVAFGGQDVERLPSASTCYNTLKLPTYKRASTLRAKLLYAINSNAGFELS